METTTKQDSDLKPSSHTDEISLKELFQKIGLWIQFLWTFWWVILIAGIIGGAIGVLYAFNKKPTYRAEFSFALEDEKGGGLGGALGLASQFGFDLGGGGGGAFSGDNLLHLMVSRSMVENALLTFIEINGKKETLADLYISFNDLRKAWDEDPQLKNVRFSSQDRRNFSRTQDSVLHEFYKNLIGRAVTVEKIDKKLSIIILRVNTENELFSKNFAEVLVNEVSRFYIDTKIKKSRENVKILQHQTDSVRTELNRAISGVASSLDANPNPNPAFQSLRVPSQRRAVDVQANQAILAELVKNLEISKVALRKETPLIQVIDKPILPLEKEKVGKFRSLIVFGFFGGFVAIFILTIRRLYRKLQTE